MEFSSIFKSPFYLLGVSARDGRSTIIEKAEDVSLDIEHELSQKARSDLTNPRTRLAAEIGWLPGVSPRKVSLLLATLLEAPMAVRNESGLPTLARLNLIAACINSFQGEYEEEDLINLIKEFASLVDELDPEDVLRDINEDRAASGFPAVRAVEQIEVELKDRKRYYRNVLRDALDRLPTLTLIEVVTETVDSVTSGGDNHAPSLIEDLIDRYEVETQDFLQREAENVHKLITAINDSAKLGKSAVAPHMDKLDAVTRNWDKVAQPIQLIAKARGVAHEASRDLAASIRSLAVELCNKHDMVEVSQRLTSLIQEIFAELPEVSERAEEDAEALSAIFEKRKNDAAENEEWAREINYSVEIGTIFKDTLSISVDGVEWEGRRFSLESITRVRWGGVRQTMNGISTGTIYTIAFGDDQSEAIVNLKNGDVYRTFIDKLWRAVGFRLMSEMLNVLKSGRGQYFGGALVHDDGVTLVKHKFLGSDERVRCTWDQVQIWAENGSFCIGAVSERKASTSISYIDVANTHILEQVVRMAFKKPGLRRLSELLK